MAAGVAIFAGPWLTTWLASPPSIGLGDVKLSGGLGLYLGWLGPGTALAALIAATLLAATAVAGVRLRHRGERDDRLAFGPALVAGAAVAVVAAATRTSIP